MYDGRAEKIRKQAIGLLLQEHDEIAALMVAGPGTEPHRSLERAEAVRRFLMSTQNS